MKVRDLFEAPLREAITADDGQGDPITERAYEELHDIIDEGHQLLKGKVGKQRSYSIGGSLSAVVSGDVKLVENYAERHYGGFTTSWDLCLQIGNGIEGGKALEEAKKLFKSCSDAIKEFEPTKVEKDDGYFRAHFNDGSVSCKYEYARSFCWVAIREDYK